MAGRDDEELLAQLGVTAARPDEYERFVIAQELAKGGAVAEENVDAALGFLKSEEDPKTRERRGRIYDVLSKLETEIAAVEAGRVAFTGPPESADDKAEEKANGARPSKEKKLRRKDGSVEGGGAAMHLAILDERLGSLKDKRKKLRGQLRLLEKANSHRDGTKRSSEPKDQGESSSPSFRKVAVLYDDDEFDAALDAENARRTNARGTPKTSPKGKAVVFMEDDDLDAALDAASTGGAFAETEREKLIRKGVITPFSKVEGFEKRVHVRSRERAPAQEDNELVRRSIANATASMAAHIKSRPATKLLDSSELPEPELPTREFRLLRTPHKRVTADGAEKKPKAKAKAGMKRKRPQPDRKYRRRNDSSSDEDEEDEENNVKKPQRRRLRIANAANGEKVEEEGLDEESEVDDEDCDAILDGGLKIPGYIFHKLFDYQKTGVKWMWELHCQKSGGIIGDEMGLGKTIQVAAFIASLHYSGLYRPSIVICPVTLLRQWKREIKKWYPSLKAEILHDSAVKGHMKISKRKNGFRDEAESDEDKGSEDGDEQELEEDEEEKNIEDEEVHKGKKPNNRAERWDAMIDRVTNSESGLLITTYEQLRINRERLLDISWGYAVLDEGHKIRNPDAEITLVCKQLQTIHRIIMTGSPIQNTLAELWSLFDFVFPGKLGVLPVFQAQFSIPIKIGVCANATPLQVSTAFKCAAVLRELVLPYLLRRMKADVDAKLPKKTEQVLFCKLTKEQRSAYRTFLGSTEVEQIIEGNRNSLFGIDILRKICNHPDLLEREHCASHPDYGNPERSGKLKLVGAVLSLWKKQGHRVLLFSQTQQMLDIIQAFAEAQGYEYRRMDGSTPVKQRMYLIDEFNDSPQVFLFIMTTKVGGLGTNLTGANRVIIYDPDWNPSTDMQARERSWRIGQTKDVTIYRLITQGTIEEKIYHRQIYKHFLANKIMKDPKQRRIFKSRDLADLFTLQEDKSGNNTSETAVLFGDSVENLLALPEAEAMKVSDETLVAMCNPVGTNDVESSKVEGSPSSSVDRDNNEIDGEQEEPQVEEARVLRDLFSANGIQSAMDHDAILGVSETEKASIDVEADRVAKRAADAIRESRMIRASDDVSVPTWTGKHGEAGIPSDLRRRFGSTTNSRLVSRLPTANGSFQSNIIQNVRSENGSNARVLAGVAAGSGVGRVLTSSDVLNRMRERRMGAIGAGMESAGPGSRVSLASSVTNTFGRGIVFGRGSAGPAFQSSASGRGLNSSSLSQQQPQPFSGRASPLPPRAGPSLQASAGQSGLGRGSPVGTFAARNGQIPGGGSMIRPTHRLTPDTQNSPTSFLGGKIGANSSHQRFDSSQLPAESEQLLAQIRAYLEQNKGSVPSAVIANHFKGLVAPKDFPLFRRLLRIAATLEQIEGMSMWTLKPYSN